MAWNTYIDEFVKSYALDYKNYEQMADYVRDLIKTVLKRYGVMAIVSSRAKNPERLKVKLERMDDERDVHYQSVQEVADSIHDLIGARIALYFPADAVLIEGVLGNEFHLQGKGKVFPPHVPNQEELRKEGYTAHKRRIYKDYDNRRFDGYHATHYRGKLKHLVFPNLNPDVEVQVASVLMHAWSEVEHDLAYKEMTGAVSRDEYECLDEINGLVIAGEIALNRLHRLSQQRMHGQKRVDNVFLLKQYLEDWLEARLPDQREPGKTSPDIYGNMNLLFDLYRRKDMLTREKVDKELKRIEKMDLNSVDEVVFWLTEHFKGNNPKLFSDAVLGIVAQNPAEDAVNKQLGNFLRNWNKLEDRLRKILRGMGHKGSNSEINWRCIVQERVLDEAICEAYYQLRLARNRVVHANRAPSMERLQKLEADLSELNKRLDETYPVN